MSEHKWSLYNNEGNFLKQYLGMINVIEEILDDIENGYYDIKNEEEKSDINE